MFNFEILLIFSPCSISLTFCGQNLCRILIKICAEYCSIFHGKILPRERIFRQHILLHLHFVSAPRGINASSYDIIVANYAIEYHWNQMIHADSRVLAIRNNAMHKISTIQRIRNIFQISGLSEKREIYRSKAKTWYIQCFIVVKVWPAFITTEFHFNQNILASKHKEGSIWKCSFCQRGSKGSPPFVHSWQALVG